MVSIKVQCLFKEDARRKGQKETEMNWRITPHVPRHLGPMSTALKKSEHRPSLIAQNNAILRPHKKEKTIPHASLMVLMRNEEKQKINCRNHMSEPVSWSSSSKTLGNRRGCSCCAP